MSRLTREQRRRDLKRTITNPVLQPVSKTVVGQLMVEFSSPDLYQHVIDAKREFETRLDTLAEAIMNGDLCSFCGCFDEPDEEGRCVSCGLRPADVIDAAAD